MNHLNSALPGILLLVWGFGLLINPCAGAGAVLYDDSGTFHGAVDETGRSLTEKSGGESRLDVLMQEAMAIASSTWVSEGSSQWISPFQLGGSGIVSTMTHRAGHVMRYNRDLMSRTFGLLRTT
ncbi:MAG: hypothetical protein A4E42_01798 [Methanoregulaceae archaeon PtaU1.Bin222]|nr:MAG: hypothetical protein A4E42_01798 [Methanoregulaceae archaeon PtaU1.Bin222]